MLHEIAHMYTCLEKHISVSHSCYHLKFKDRLISLIKMRSNKFFFQFKVKS